jgi:hypothetical protein
MRLWLVSLLVVTACRGRSPQAEQEIARREEWVRKQAEIEDAGAAWFLTSTRDVHFEDGWYPMEHEPTNDVRGRPWRWMGRTAMIKLRAHGGKPMRLTIAGGVPLDIVKANPIVTVTLDGQRLASDVAPGGLKWVIDVPPPMIASNKWVDLVISTSAWGFVRGDPRELGFSLETLRWEEIAP